MQERSNCEQNQITKLILPTKYRGKVNAIYLRFLGSRCTRSLFGNLVITRFAAHETHRDVKFQVISPSCWETFLIRPNFRFRIQ